MADIPLALRHSLESGHCVLFVGAGAGRHLLSNDGTPAPDGAALTSELADYFNIPGAEYHTLANLSEYVEITKGRTELETFLKKKLADLTPDPILQWIPTIRWKAIYTTNYDNGIERCYELAPNPAQTPRVAVTTSDLSPIDRSYEVPIYHLHGSIVGATVNNLIITESDYIRFREKRRMLFELLKNDYATSHILYIGYSHKDHNWNTIIEELSAEFQPSKPPVAFRVSPNTSDIDKAILASKNIQTIDSTFSDFVQEAKSTLSNYDIGLLTHHSSSLNVPNDLSDLYRASPAATHRFLKSWTYVNQASFNEESNLQNFLRGDRPNWGLIASNQYFERDIEETTYNCILDFVTSPSKKPRNIVIVGPAGYGTSTLLMSIAVRTVKERAGCVFMLKPGAAILEGDIEFITASIRDRVIFAIDNAADHSENIHTASQLLKKIGRPAMFILGERLNEWRYSRGRISAQEIELEPLSTSEINRLIDFLAEHGALNQLEHLDRQLQVSAIEKKHGKELLVAMREATEGNSFDAIIEDEFDGIKNETARKIYLISSAFYQSGTYIRDNLLAAQCNIGINELYDTCRNFLEGVILFDCIDEVNGRYGARARHRTIASIAWERCGSIGNKEDIIQHILRSLNLNYRVDVDAFEYFVRTDRFVDDIRSLEGKTRYFDTACQKDPDSPYVRQHYARMLLRNDKTELALSQIESALRINPHIKVLYHTKGLILSHLTRASESIEIARRWRIQSEAAFLRGIGISKHDDYCYTGLADLYLEWAKRSSNTDESEEYISKAESTIADGLRHSKNREGLWIKSAEIEKWLGDEPSRLLALERAVKEKPGGVIARYLLGRSYRKSGRTEEACKLLNEVVQRAPEEFRAVTEYALSLLDSGEPYSRAISVMRLASLYGFRDAKFIAILGGMLFMSGQFSEATKVFEESQKRDFTASELNKIWFRPRRSGANSPRVGIEGRVSVVKAGYMLIDSSEYPQFICPGRNIGKEIMRANDRVSFQPGFSARGGVAENLGSRSTSN